jgi:ACS family hexuronate transporter-like MFS transporter
MFHALASSTMGFTLARIALGLGEGGNFPAAVKAVAEWFPKRDRALATGIFNSGTNIAAIAGPPIIAWIYSSYGWRQAFLWTGALGFIWLIFWWRLFDIPSKRKRISAGELAYIKSDTDPATETPAGTRKNINWPELFGFRQTWTIILGKFLTDPVWWFSLILIQHIT